MPESVASIAVDADIACAYRTSARRDRHGNEFRQRAKAAFSDGEFYIYDVWLKRQ